MVLIKRSPLRKPKAHVAQKVGNVAVIDLVGVRELKKLTRPVYLDHAVRVRKSVSQLPKLRNRLSVLFFGLLLRRSFSSFAS